MTAVDAEASRVKAEARFRRLEEARSSALVAVADVERARLAERAKTERLKALRLAKEAADREASSNQPPKARVRKRTKPVAVKAGKMR